MSRSEWRLSEFAAGAAAADIGPSGRGMFAVLAVLVTVIAAAVLWASLATIEEVARAQGTVIPSGRAQTLESLEGGIVRDILVSEGEEVTEGQVLIRIDDTGASANLGELTARRKALRAQALRLDAEVEDAEALSFAGSDVAEDDPLALREVALFDTRRASYFGQIAVLEAQALQRQQEIEELANAMDRATEQIALLDEEIALRLASGVVPRAQILPLERELSVKRQEADGLASRRDQAIAALSEADARLREVELQRRAEISTQRSETLNELAVIEEAIRRASDVVVRADLRAPVNGLVSELNVNTIGAVIAPGEEVLRIVPLEETLEVTARVRPEDIAFIRPGLHASVKLTSFDFTIYGALAGTVTRIGADSQQDEQTGEVYFPITVRTDRSYLERRGERLDILPGMVASVDILTGERTVLDYLLKPFRKARLEALRER